MFAIFRKARKEALVLKHKDKIIKALLNAGIVIQTELDDLKLSYKRQRRLLKFMIAALVLSSVLIVYK